MGSRYRHTASARGGSFYLVGGSDPASGEVASSGVFSFDADSCEWDQVTINGNGFAGEEHSAVMGTQALYLFGGQTKSGTGACTSAFLG